MDRSIEKKLNFLFITLIVFLFIIRVVYSLSYDIDLQGIEFYFLHHCQLLYQHKALYHDPVKFPFIINFYPPLFENIFLVLFHWFKVNPVQDIHSAFILGRIFSLLQIFFCLLLLFKIIALYRKEHGLYIVIILLFLLLLPEHYYTLRPDSIKVTFFLAFLYFVLSDVIRDQPAKGIIFGSACGVIAIYLKHDIIIYIITVYIVLFFLYRKRSLLYGFVLFSILTVSAFFYFQYVYGENFSRSIFMYNFQYSSSIWINLMFISYNLFRTFPLVLFTLINTTSADRHIKTIAYISVALYVISNLFLFRTGSNLHYTIESVLLLLINAAIYRYSRLFFYSRKTVAFMAAVLFFNHFLVYRQFITPAQWEKEKDAYCQMVSESAILKEEVRNNVVFFPNAKHVIFNSSMNLIYGYDIHFDRFSELYLPIKITPNFIFTDFREYDDCFRNGFVKYIIIEDEQKARRQMTAYYTHYILLKRAGGMLIYQYDKKGG